MNEGKDNKIVSSVDGCAEMEKEKSMPNTVACCMQKTANDGGSSACCSEMINDKNEATTSSSDQQMTDYDRTVTACSTKVSAISLSSSEAVAECSKPVEKKDEEQAVVVKAKPIRKIVKGPVRLNKIPQEILDDPNINEAIKCLPENYNFEIHKTIWRIRESKAKRVALQMPDGLTMFACRISDIIEEFTDADTVIMADVTYGACCVDDFTAKRLGADFLIHYGHSCLIPIDKTSGIKMLYVFVDIKFDTVHCIETIKFNFPNTTKISLIGTIQFASSLQAIATELRKFDYNITIPQIKPLSPGEVLGCTAPRIKDVDVLVYIGDGRFHLEAAMIANPNLPAYRYDPYEGKITIETYDHEEMKKNRKDAMDRARNAKMFGILFGTLGRQGSPTVLDTITNRLQALNKNYMVILTPEIIPENLRDLKDIDAFIQIACPRLSIDWGTDMFEQPLLTPYEAAVVLKMIEMDEKQPYPMDYYSNTSLGPWTPNFKPSDLAKPNESCCGKCKDETNTDKPCK
ncbi:2-(3-amino-3-carboxypropyl)histidine synthase subunit 1-like [Copidosoma floridanum]|uniref:2-(3-amino-3-carboxypropyl)histidine synthase subunit 1-like n=2 Tax=Copidosoma floridanum TaxID=29053 RepID=UPI000C6F6503|nr:2-(3-amino-3-carboxypropyl)histidine synthase subunit 1-like [Copidosoma floridanum]XP_023246401.1 2-(3-amino-3-carboxypropyl)histidine synthase subunit 1-like [Copidosoma floridanum]